MSPRADPRGACTICGRPRTEQFKPFCSKRCADLDLARWFKGSYAIPGAPDQEKSGPEPEIGGAEEQ
jgi:endogenous inhibitor of DNA gyrase (YacG/DUF329 family)